MKYQSYLTIDSKCRPGVSFAIRRVSLGRRIELTRRIRELAGEVEFLEAGKDPTEKIEAALLAAEVDRIYFLWGLVKVEGLQVDGRAATPEALLDSGPEDLCSEVLAAIKAELGLSEAERKN